MDWGAGVEEKEDGDSSTHDTAPVCDSVEQHDGTRDDWLHYFVFSGPRTCE